jgi:flagellar hook assembly protein FlgD
MARRLRTTHRILFILITVMIAVGLGCTQRTVETVQGPSAPSGTGSSGNSTQVQFSISATQATFVIEFAIPSASWVYCEMQNVSGKKVKVLCSGAYQAGIVSVSWDLTNDRGERVKTGFYNVFATASGQVWVKQVYLNLGDR